MISQRINTFHLNQSCLIIDWDMNAKTWMFMVFLLPTAAFATDCKLQTHVASKHYVKIDKSWQQFGVNKYNETNPGISITCGHLGVGTYKNSFYEESHFVAYVTTPIKWLGVEWTASLGAATGYDRVSNVGMLMPFSTQSAGIQLYQGAQVMISHFTGGAFVFSFQFDL